MTCSAAHQRHRIRVRTRCVALGLCLFWCGLVGRVAALQLGDAGFRDAANSQRTRSVQVEALTGRILDRRDEPLAISVRQPSVFADPSRIDSIEHFVESVAPILGIDHDKIERDLQSHRTQQFRWLARRVSNETVDKLNNLHLPKRSWGVRHEHRRVYPQGTVAAHILGLRGLDRQAHGGIEELFADQLAGKPGIRRVVSDSRGRPLSLLSEMSQPPTNGDEIRLTLDARLSTAVGLRLDQAFAHFEPNWAAAIVIDPRNGELLAAESRPTYDPNNPVDIATAGFHHAFRATFEPGSTVKPFLVAAALECGRVQADSIIDCGPGRGHVAGRPMRDAAALGQQPLKNVLAKSSNIGSARVAEMLGPQELYNCYRHFGFGQPVPTTFNTPTSGVLVPPTDWSGYSLGSLSIGHEMSVTPLQLAAAYATLTQGRRVIPRLIRESGRLVEYTGRSTPKEVTSWLLEEALTLAVAEGTAKSLQIDGVEVFGKTGTAQKFDPELGAYRTDRATCVVVGGFPAHQPTRVVVVVIDNPTLHPPFSGGRVAGPVVHDILESCLRLAEVRTN